METVRVIDAIVEATGVSVKSAEMILDKAIEGGELEGQELDAWLEQRFLPNVVLLDQDEYARMCVDALKIMMTTAGTDYGSSRQRDLAQLWADITRGYLGEFAFVKFLQKRFNVGAELAHEQGGLEEFLPLDVSRVQKPKEDWRKPNLKISIKTTKWNGIWLDIPGAQFQHSDVYTHVRIGGERDHLIGFFKSLSIFKDKILKKGISVGSLTEEQAAILHDQLPEFRPVPAYICGFIMRQDSFTQLDYTGRRGRKHYEVRSWRGPYRKSDLALIKDREGLDSTGKVEFRGLKEFRHDSAYIFNPGNLRWSKEDWDSVIEGL